MRETPWLASRPPLQVVVLVRFGSGLFPIVAYRFPPFRYRVLFTITDGRRHSTTVGSVDDWARVSLFLYCHRGEIANTDSLQLKTQDTRGWSLGLEKRDKIGAENNLGKLSGERNRTAGR